jgi:hypothetical protein
VSWRSIRVFYYDDDKDALILEGVRPLFRRLQTATAAAYFIRHWSLGPHLRLELDCEHESFDSLVLPAVHEVIGGFLAVRPSTLQLDPGRHLALHRRLAALEREHGPLLPWEPNNSIGVAPVERRMEVPGSEEADLLAGFYTDTTDLCFEMIEQTAGANRRLALAFDLMIATAHALSGVGIAEGFVSFRSHAEGFLSGSPEGAALRDRWDDHYRRHADALVERVRAVVAGLDAQGRGSGVAGPWVEALTPHRERAARLIEQKGDAPAGTAPDDLLTSLATVSPFHRRLLAGPGWAELQSAPGFGLYRVMLNYSYLHLTRLGVTPAERHLLCHLAACAVEDCYGVSASEVISQPVRRIPDLPAAVSP